MEEIPQEKIQAWIERIIAYIRDVIRLEGGNEYPFAGEFEEFEPALSVA